MFSETGKTQKTDYLKSLKMLPLCYCDKKVESV